MRYCTNGTNLLGVGLDVVEVLLLSKLSSDLIDDGSEVADIILGLEGVILGGNGVGKGVLESNLHAVDTLVSLIVGETVDSLTDDVGLLTEDIIVTQTYYGAKRKQRFMCKYS
jgi:hypothetical protein